MGSFEDNTIHLIYQLQALTDIVLIGIFVVGAILFITAIALLGAAVQGMRSSSMLGRQVSPGLVFGTFFSGMMMIIFPAFVRFNVYVLTPGGIAEDTNPFSYATPMGSSSEDLARLLMVTILQLIGIIVMAVATYQIKEVVNPNPSGGQQVTGWGVVTKLFIGALLIIPMQALHFFGGVVPFISPIINNLTGGNSGGF